MSQQQINCPRCSNRIIVNRHQERLGQLGCPQCGQLIRLAPATAPDSVLSMPMVAPATQPSGYWNQSPQARKQSNTALWAVAVASLGMFLTVLTLCVTFLLWQKEQAAQRAQLAGENQGGFLPPDKEEPKAPQPIQPAVNEQPPPQVAQQPAEPPPAPAAPVEEDPLGRNQNQNNQTAETGPAQSAPPPAPAPAPPAQPFIANKPTKHPPPEPLPLPEPERPKPIAGNEVIK